MLQKFFKNKNISKKLKLRLKNTIIDKVLTYASETGTVTKGDRKELNVFERKVYRRILGPVCDNEKENWKLLTNKEIYASVKNPTIIEAIRLNRLCWFGHVQRMEENRGPKRVLYMNLGTTRLRGRKRSRWQDGVREDGRIVGVEGWQKKVHNRKEWKKLLGMARNCQILHLPMERMNKYRPPISPILVTHQLLLPREQSKKSMILSQRINVYREIAAEKRIGYNAVQEMVESLG